MAEWHYLELCQGNTYVGYVMDGSRVVCRIEHHGGNICQDPGENVERSRRELRLIVKQGKSR